MTDRDDQQNPPPSSDGQSGGYAAPDQSGYTQPDQPAAYAQQPQYGEQSDGQPGAYGQSGGYSQPNQYAQPNPYAQAGYGTPAPKKTLSLIGMILGIVGIVFSWIVFIPIVGSVLGLFVPAGAVVLGFLGRSKEGVPAKGFWITALILGFVGIAIAIIALIGWIALFSIGESGGLDDYNY